MLKAKHRPGSHCGLPHAHLLGVGACDRNLNGGAASVLVVFLMLVLVTLGAFTISAAAANLRLSRRTLNWNACYYELDGQAETVVAVIDSGLAQAESDAWDAVTARAEDDGLVQLFSDVYMARALEILTEMKFDQSNINIYNTFHEDAVDYIGVDFTVNAQTPGFEGSGLTVSLSIYPPDYVVELDAEDVGLVELDVGLGVQWDGERYDIDGWREFQTSSDENQPAPIWDGTFDW